MGIKQDISQSIKEAKLKKEGNFIKLNIGVIWFLPPITLLSFFAFIFGFTFLGCMFLLAGLYVGYYFRDPARITNHHDDGFLLASPIDGLVASIEEISVESYVGGKASQALQNSRDEEGGKESESDGGNGENDSKTKGGECKSLTLEEISAFNFPSDVKMQKISIYSGMLDMKLIKMPSFGKIVESTDLRGKNLAHFAKTAEEENSRTLFTIETDIGVKKYGLSVVGGMLARKTKLLVEKKRDIAIGSNLAIVYLGNFVVNLYVPSSVKLKIQPGQRLVAGETLIGKLETPLLEDKLNSQKNSSLASNNIGGSSNSKSAGRVAGVGSASKKSKKKAPVKKVVAKNSKQLGTNKPSSSNSDNNTNMNTNANKNDNNDKNADIDIAANGE